MAAHHAAHGSRYREPNLSSNNEAVGPWFVCFGPKVCPMMMTRWRGGRPAESISPNNILYCGFVVLDSSLGALDAFGNTAPLISSLDFKMAYPPISLPVALQCGLQRLGEMLRCGRLACSRLRCVAR